jgi:hypothetical protein
MVGAPATPARLTHVGQVFVMNMTYRDGDHVEHYQSDNHVMVLTPVRAIAWATATRGGAPLGWLWRYDLEAADDGVTILLTYDWTSTAPETIRRFGVSLVDATAWPGRCSCRRQRLRRKNSYRTASAGR